MSKSAILVLDLGNSETRGIVLYGKDSDGKPRERYFSLCNRFADVSEDYTPPVDYTPDTSTVLKINAVVRGEEVSGYYANGEVQQREFNIAPLRPSATEKKYNILTSALSFELAMLHAYRAIADLDGVSSIESLDIEWSVDVLLPPGDLEAGKVKIIELLKSVTEVCCTFPNVRIPIKLKKVNVLPEGFCAYIATVYDRGSLIRKNAKHLLKETTLIFDIGAGTTDIAVVKDSKIINVTMHSIDRGGNNVTQLVRRSIRVEYDGLSLPESDIAEGIIKGYIKDGSRQIDIVPLVNAAKDEVAKYLISDVQGYLEETEFPIRSIGKILVCGGGAINSSENGGTKALSSAIITYLKKLAPYVELVDLPKDTITGEEISPRELNVRGASILAALMG